MRRLKASIIVTYRIQDLGGKNNVSMLLTDSIPGILTSGLDSSGIHRPVGSTTSGVLDMM